MVIGGLLTEILGAIGSGGHYGCHLKFGMLQLYEIDFNVFFSLLIVFIVTSEFLNPQYPTLDTKIIVASYIVTKICDIDGSGSHLGSHLELRNVASIRKYYQYWN